MTRARRKQCHQRGQAVPIVALVFVVLIGATALAVDLSLQTHSRRSFQNVTDAAALAGARELPKTVATANQTAAVNAAFKSMQANLGLPANWYGSPSNTCPSVGVCEKVNSYTNGGTTYTVTVNTPPQTTANGALKCSGSPAGTDPCLHNVEVILHGSSNSSNPLSGFLGFGAGTEAGSSIAFHNGSDVPFGFALFSSTYVATGNQVTVVKGDVYADRKVDLQSKGQAGFCADDWTPPSGGTSHGYVILGALQANQAGYANDGQSSVLPATAKVITHALLCTSLSAGFVGETATVASSSDCPTITGLPAGESMVFVPGTLACVLSPALPAPTFAPPTTTAGLGTNIVTVPACMTYSDAGHAGDVWPTTRGLYKVTHSSCNGSAPDLSINLTKNETLNGFTFYLDQGATVSITGGNTLTIDPYNPNSPTVVTNNINDDGVYAFYGTTSGSPTLNIGASGGSSNNTVVDIKTGAVTMTTGTVNITSNAQLLIDAGQAVVNTWNDQSGNHPNPSITFGGGSVPGEQEVLELVQ